MLSLRPIDLAASVVAVRKCQILEARRVEVMREDRRPGPIRIGSGRRDARGVMIYEWEEAAMVEKTVEHGGAKDQRVGSVKDLGRDALIEAIREIEGSVANQWANEKFNDGARAAAQVLRAKIGLAPEAPLPAAAAP
jgi:hypothetical protein